MVIKTQKEFEELIFEFAKQASRMEKIFSVMLFGSVAREEADAKSDIDILVVFDSLNPVKKIKEKADIGRVALDIEKKFNKNIQLVFANKGFEGLDRQFIEQVFKEGIIIYGRQPHIDAKKLKLLPYSLIHYSMEELKTADKMRLKAALYGRKTIKKTKEKVYRSESKGLIKELEGRRSGIASVLVPAKKAKYVSALLKRFGASYEKIDLWISEV